MITQAVANSLTDRALSAYYRSGSKKGGQVSQPGDVEAMEFDGLWYIRMTNVNGILAVYRIREVNGEPTLKGLKRWPKALED
jgi:hypothetical protein